MLCMLWSANASCPSSHACLVVIGGPSRRSCKRSQIQRAPVLQVERDLWGRASRTALDIARDLPPPINMLDINERTYDGWVAGMTNRYGPAGADSVRGVHACLALVVPPLMINHGVYTPSPSCALFCSQASLQLNSAYGDGQPLELLL